ncbi:hypothetical protein M9H77_34179 [Catharanthus roseus]|uniref:Uncharacterized protein n=1 Tax=Catharanthus roseus TaxID=4058 RepID=A0ACB9ZLA9_CATRO|nr:hypothetical protein M9H77_34179 [Catharanthus roseus]
MDIFFQPASSTVKPFSIEIGFFDTVLEIKEKIEKHQSIPVSKQTLIFNGNILQDDLNIHHSDILDRSQIRLLIAADPTPPPPPPSESNNQNSIDDDKSDHQLLSSPASKKIHILVKMPNNSKLVEMELTDTIKALKEKVGETEGVPINRLIANAKGIELQDDRNLGDFELVDHSEIEFSIIKPSSSGAATSSGSSGSNVKSKPKSKRLRVIVLTKCGRKITVYVNPNDNVGELKNELEELNKEMNLSVLQEDYFFIHKQNVMEDDRSFRWHHVVQGDIIEVFSGTISGGQ